MAEREYQRLTRAANRTTFGIISIGRSSLWLGKDHLLSIDTTGYTENYKRFFFRDIQALIFRRNRRWMISMLVLGALAAICGSLMALAINSGVAAAAWILGSVTALWLALIVVELLKGPTCTCHIRTAVQTEELPSLNRVRRAHKVLSRLRPLLAEAQGVLAPEEVPVRLQEWMALNDPMRVPPPGASTTPTTATATAVGEEPNAPPRILS